MFVQSGLGAGGAEKIVNLLARHRLGRGDEVFVLCFDGSRPSYFTYPPDVRLEAPEVSDFDRRSPVRLWKYLRWLRKRMRELRPTVVVSFLMRTNVLVLLAGSGLGIPSVISERNNPFRQKANPVWLPTWRVLSRRAAAIVMQTPQALQTLPAGLRSSAVVIGNPCSVPEGARRSPDLGRRIVAVGRLEHQKGFDLLLQAFSRIGSGARNATLTIYGEGPEREALVKLAHSLGIADLVRLPGLTAAPGTWIEAADVFVLSSRFEGFPNVLVEAMAVGMPSIAFDCPWGPSTIIEDGVNGLLVPAGDVQSMASGLERLIADRELRTKLSTAAIGIADRFSPSMVLDQWDAVIDGVARPAAGSPL
jgi:glycosyltransferase involved in cell wall biosynthesis